jgi:glycosidase
MLHRRALLASLALVTLLPLACFDFGDDDENAGTGAAGPGATSGPSGGPGGAGGGGGEGQGGAGADGQLCPTRFEFKPDGAVENPRVAGEWHGFALADAAKLSGPDGDGVYSATVDVPVGLQAYKLVIGPDGGESWILDPGQPRRKYAGDVENSAVKVPDCRLPVLQVQSNVAARPAPGQGTFKATLAYVDGIQRSGPDAAGFEAELISGGASKMLAAPELVVDATSGAVTLDIGSLADGKHTVRVVARAKNGNQSEVTRLVFWIEAEPFSWKDALIYMVVVDRFENGDPGNDPSATADADPRGDWKGGDLDGVRQAIADGTLDQLGVRAIWLTPFNENPQGAYIAADGVHKVTGYHGYWPVKARAVDQRIGGAEALRALVTEAHAHGIRVLQDYVLNHVHQDHEYVSQHPDWFRTFCVCGTDGCDWTTHALECVFSEYMPDVNHAVPEANAAFVDDAVWWLDEFDLDGLRVDAVKHVEESATRNLAAEVREKFELADTRYFLMGETAMGWSDCPDPCNDENYGTIAKYVGPHGLDGQFDFVLYHGVSYRTFAWGDKGMLHASYWVEHGLSKWPADAIMTPYIGSHDTARFATYADYRGQDGAHDKGIPGNQWGDTAVAPGDAEPYRRTRLALSWLLGLPGAPLLYYGDEYGQWGGADPNNRLMWRGGGGLLTTEEAATLALSRKLGSARKNITALRRGGYKPLSTTEDTLVFARPVSPGNAAIVALTRSGSSVTMDVEVASALGFAAGTVLKDALGGPSVTVGGNGHITVPLPAYGSAVLAP